jgi:heat shock protein HslJ
MLGHMNKLALLLALPAILACAPPPGARLVGSKWTIARIDGAPAVSDRARMEFLPGRISATVGCNGLGGEWKVRGDRLETGPFMSTQMYCEGLMEQEAALSRLFEAKPAFTLSGNRLTLTGGGHTAELVRAR